MNIKIHSNLL